MDNRRHNRGFFDPKLCCRWLIKLKAAAGAPQGLGLELDQPTAEPSPAAPVPYDAIIDMHCLED